MLRASYSHQQQKMTMNNILSSGCLRIIQTIPKLSSELLPADEKTSQNILKVIVLRQVYHGKVMYHITKLTSELLPPDEKRSQNTLKDNHVETGLL